jgi:hypothetical protein
MSIIVLILKEINITARYVSNELLDIFVALPTGKK